MEQKQTRLEQKAGEINARIAEEARQFKLNIFNYLFDQYLAHTLTLEEATQTFQEVMDDAHTMLE